MTEDEPLGFENCNEASDKKVIRSSLGTVECFPVDTASRFFTLENKAEDVCDLTISKQVTGNLGSREEEFSFDISFYDAAGKHLTGLP